MKKRIISLLMSLVMVISLVGVVPSMTVGAEEDNTFTWGDFQCHEWNNTITIDKYLAHEKSINIPEKINGLPVTSIGDHAFGATIVTQEVKFPNTLKSIGESAFEDNWDLKEIILPDSVSSIGKYAFKNCTALKVLKLPDDSCRIEFGAFEGCWQLEELNVGGFDKYEDFNWFIDSYLRRNLPSDCLIICNYYQPHESNLERKYAYEYAQENGYKYEFSNIINNYAYEKLKNYYDEVNDEYFYNGECAITRYLGEEKEISVPSYLNEMKVTSVWYLNDTVNSVILPSSVNDMDDIGKNIESINVPAGISNFSFYGYNNYKKLKKITFDEGREVIGNRGWSDDDGDYDVRCPKAVETIVLPSTLKKIYSGTFKECSNLKEINIPVNVDEISIDAFNFCYNLQSINVNSKNKYYSSQGGLLYNKNKTALYFCPGGATNYSIPNTVKTIESEAFNGCKSTKEIVIPEGVEKISEDAFMMLGYPKLETIVIPKSVKSMEECGLGYYEDYPNISKIYSLKIKCYSGTAGEKYAKDNGFEYELLDKPHTHNYTSNITKQPTCTETGVKTYTCSCGNTYTETIAKKSHSYSTAWTIDKTATCTSEGSKSHHCTVCGDKKDITTIDMIEHIYDLGVVTKEPTETDTGVKTYTCTVCQNTKTETIPELIHTHNYISNDTKQPTCTETGEKTYTCSCGDIYTETVPVVGHNFVNTIIKATGNTEGYTLHTCSVCGYSYKDNYTNVKKPATVTGFKVTKTTANNVKLSWKKVSGAEGYIVYRYDSSKKGWKRIGKSKSGSICTATAVNLKAGTTYKFAIKAYKTVNGKELTSQKYPQLTTSTNPAKVSFNLSSKKGKSTIKWTKVKGATGYKLYYKTSKNGKWKTIATVKSNYSYYITSKPPKGKTCWFTVKAYRTVNKKTYNGTYTAKSMKVK